MDERRGKGHKKEEERYLPLTFWDLPITVTRHGKGTFKVGCKTNPKKMRAKLKAMNQWLKSIRNAIEFKEWWPILKQKLIGHYRYYGISGNMRGIRIYYSQSVKLAYKWVNRRSQKKSFNWEKYRRLIYEWNPLPQPKIYHLTYTLSSKRKCY